MKINEFLNEIDNGPGTYKGHIPQVNHARHRADAAKIDFSSYGKGAKPVKPAKIKAAIIKPEKPSSDQIMRDIDAAIGRAYPDIEPNEYLKQYSMSQLDKAVRDSKLGKNFNDYVDSVWQQYQADNPQNESSVEGEDNYSYTHGKKPSGHGNWVFSKHRSHDVRTHSDEDKFEHRGTYSEAKKAAKKWAKEKGHSTAYVQT